MMFLQRRVQVCARPRHTTTTIIRTRSPPTTKPKPKPLAVGLDWSTLNTEAHYIGKAITVFTMIYCSLNWLMYKKAREDGKEDGKENGDDDG